MANASQLRLVDDQPFPHTLPINSTPYANNASNSTGAGYDGPGACGVVQPKPEPEPAPEPEPGPAPEPEPEPEPYRARAS